MAVEGMTVTINHYYSTADVPFPTKEFNGYSMEISKDGEILEVKISQYSREKGGYYNNQTLKKGEKGFEENVIKVFRALQNYNFQQNSLLKKDFPDLYETLKVKSES